MSLIKRKEKLVENLEQEQHLVFEAMEHDWTEEELEDFYHQVNG